MIISEKKIILRVFSLRCISNFLIFSLSIFVASLPCLRIYFWKKNLCNRSCESHWNSRLFIESFFWLSFILFSLNSIFKSSYHIAMLSFKMNHIVASIFFHMIRCLNGLQQLRRCLRILKMEKLVLKRSSELIQN